MFKEADRVQRTIFRRGTDARLESGNRARPMIRVMGITVVLGLFGTPALGQRSVVDAVDVQLDSAVSKAQLKGSTAAARQSARGGQACNAANAFVQLPDNTNASTSDLGTGFVVRDDFNVTSFGTLDSICIWGIYNNFGESTDCGPATDQWNIVVQNSDASMDLFTFTNADISVNKNTTGRDLLGRLEYLYEVSFNAPVAVAAGCYWLQVTNEAGSTACSWLWELGLSGNGRAQQDIIAMGTTAQIPDRAFNINVGTNTGDPMECIPDNDPCSLVANEFNSQQSNGENAFNSSVDNFAAADTFSIFEDDTEINAICWKGLYTGAVPVDDAFTITFYNVDSDNIPTTPIVSFTESPSFRISRGEVGQVVVGFTEYGYAAGFAPSVHLDAGCYALEIVNDLGGDAWFWSEGASQGDGYLGEGDGFGLQTNAGMGMYTRFDIIPEDFAFILGDTLVDQPLDDPSFCSPEIVPDIPCCMDPLDCDLTELDACGLMPDTNAGCNVSDPTMPEFTTIPFASGVVCGAVNAVAGQRDTDWYEYTAQADGFVNFELQGTGDFVAYALDANDCSYISLLATADDVGSSPDPLDCLDSTPADAPVAVTAGQVIHFFVATGRAEGPIFDGVPCDQTCDNPDINYRLVIDGPTGNLCEIITSGADYFEAEVCGTAINDGCNAMPPSASDYEDITNGVVAGTVVAGGGTRDTDWYRYTFPSDGELVVNLQAEFDGIAFVLDIDDEFTCATIGVLSTADDETGDGGGPACENGTDGDMVVAGSTGDVVYIFVSSGDATGGLFEGVTCGVNESYLLTVEGPGNPPSCPCDWDGSGILNSDDFFSFLTSFLVDFDADFNGDGITNSDDFFDFLACFLNPQAGC